MATMTDVIRRIWEDGYCLEVKPWAEVPGYVALEADGEENVNHWGATQICMPPDFAEQLGRALIAAAQEARDVK